MKKFALVCVIACAFTGCQKTVKIEVEGVPSMSGTISKSGPTQAEKDAAKAHIEQMMQQSNADAEAYEKQMDAANKASIDTMNKLNSPRK